MASKEEELLDTSNTCVVCFKGVEIYSIGQCDHPVCFECSTRMRVLCRQNECPICRQDMPKVIFTRNVRLFSSIQDGQYLTDFKFKISFESKEEASAFEHLLAHECPNCKKIFNSFTQLRDHVRRTHFLNYCDLCVENLKILSRERRCYTRQELAMHRREGDVDDRSHRGHPLCKFCDTRYMDNDELYRHLRRDHLYCHFCDADGLYQYYNTYDFLREHFRNDHYLCEEGDCYNEKFTAVFRTDIDLKAHKTTAHGKGLGKAGLKQARTLDIEFTLTPRPRPPPRNRQFREEEMEVGAVGGTIFEEPPSNPINQFAQINTDCVEEFPSLGGTASTVPSLGPGPIIGRSSNVSSVVRKGTGRLNDDDFPALGPDTTQVRLRVNSERPLQNQKQASTIQNSRPSSTNVSIQVTHPRFTTTVTSHNTYNYHFPALDTGPGVSSATTTTSVHWTSKKPSDFKASEPINHSQQQANVTTVGASGHDPPPGLEAFPALNLQGRNKTSSQISTQAIATNSSDVMTNADTDQNTVIISSKTKKKKSKTKTNVSTTTEARNLKDAGATNNNCNNNNNDSNNKKKVNNVDDRNLTDSSTSHTISSKKKSKDVVSQSKNDVDGVNSVNNNKKALKFQKLESSSNQVNHSDLKKKGAGDSKSSAAKEKGSAAGNEKKKDTKAKPSSVEKLLVEPEAFPALSNSGVPPGFQPKWQVKRPPPGLAKPANVMVPPVSGPAPPIAPPGFNLLNGFPPLTADVQATETKYITPPNFAKRNNDLVTKMTSALGPEALELFKQVSFSFRSGSVPPDEYYSACREIMGATTFKEIFPELVALLPDIEKQQELWTVYKSKTINDEPARTNNSSKKKIVSANNYPTLEVCATCYQVVSSFDLRDHLTYHALDNHFPVLDSHSSSSSHNNNAWIQQHK